MKHYNIGLVLSILATFIGTFANAGNRENDPKVDNLAIQFQNAKETIEDLDGTWKCQYVNAHPGTSGVRLITSVFKRSRYDYEWTGTMVIRSPYYVNRDFFVDPIVKNGKNVIEAVVNATLLNKTIVTTASFRSRDKDHLIIEFRDHSSVENADPSIANPTYSAHAYMACTRSHDSDKPTSRRRSGVCTIQ